MKKIWRILSIAIICGALSAPQIEARGRNNNSGNRSERTSSSRGNASRPSVNRNNNAPKPSNNSRPGVNKGNHAPKPGNKNGYRPGVNKGNHAPKPSYGHSHKPGHVYRPHCPPPRPYYRPTPPPTFRPYHGCPVLRSVFGITFGTAINISLDYLYRNSYNVNGYGNDVIYLRNVNQYGYLWPDATLYYGVGGLTGTQLMYSTNFYDRGRYNNVYRTLVNQYGSPISVQNISNGIIATWWGYDNQYVSLEFRPIYTNNGQLRYFTTLSLGI